MVAPDEEVNNKHVTPGKQQCVLVQPVTLAGVQTQHDLLIQFFGSGREAPVSRLRQLVADEIVQHPEFVSSEYNGSTFYLRQSYAPSLLAAAMSRSNPRLPLHLSILAFSR